MSEQSTTDMSQHFYRASAVDFMKTPGNLIAYWFTDTAVNNFVENPKLSDFSDAKSGMSSCNSELFLRQWFEVSKSSINTHTLCISDTKKSKERWFPYNKGGGNRRWFGYNETVINWGDDGYDLKKFVVNNPKDPNTTHWSRRLFNLDYFFKTGITWSAITSGRFSCRKVPSGIIPGTGSKTLYNLTLENERIIFSLLNSNIASYYLSALSPTLNYEAGDVGKIPIKNSLDPDKLKTNVLTVISQKDWNASEDSLGFSNLQLIISHNNHDLLAKTFKNLRYYWLDTALEMQRLEEENNRIFIDAYGLQDELKPEVPLKEITLTCNPYYRYGGDLTEQQREERLQSDTIAELISYAIGCMMGRYSLDREGLVYAHAGNQDFAELVSEGAYTTFAADDDAILPITEQEWFSDDVTNRVSEFIRTVYDEQHLEENLQFIADSLCLYAIKPKKGERALETIRRYLGTQFYKDHLKTYKRRPIYWLFSSGKHKAFECLVYLHRYHEGTLARMRTEYVIPLTARINARINRLHEEVEAASSTSERKQITSELKVLQNQQAELATFDEQLRHHADMRISIDLDDGVKENYGKFGNLLAAVKDVTGKAAE